MVSGLTKKFSRSSLKQATLASTQKECKMHNMEEEIARARSKRFNSESWKKVSKQYQVLPQVPTASSSNISSKKSSHSMVSSTHILSTMSSLTEDPALQQMTPQFRQSESFATPVGDLEVSTPRVERDEDRVPPPSDEERPNDSTLPSLPYGNGRGIPVSNHKKPPLYEVKATKTTPASKMLPHSHTTRFETASDGINPPSSSTPQKTNNPLGNPAASSANAAYELSPSIRRNTPPTRSPPNSNSLSTSANKAQRPRRFTQLQHKKKPTNISPQSSKYLARKKAKRNPFLPYPKKKVKQTTFFSVILQVLQVLQDFFLFPLRLLLGDDTVWDRRRSWKIHNKNVLITNATSGLGCELARQWAAQGAKLALVCQHQDQLEELAAECQTLGSLKTQYYAADLSNSTGAELAMKQVLGDFKNCIDVVVLQGSQTHGCYFEEMRDAKQIDTLIQSNLNGSITTLYHVLPHVPKCRDSRIVLLSNTLGLVAAPYQSLVSATQHALTGFANSLRIELHQTYGRSEAPRVVSVHLPELTGNVNTGKLDMGAKLPAAKRYSWAGLSLPQAVHELLPAIEVGQRDFGATSQVNWWRALYTIIPNWVDFWVVNHVQKTHYRPLEERTSSYPKKATTSSPSSLLAGKSKVPINRSWGN